MTDIIKFDHQGFRTDFTLDIVELGPSGLRKTGTWNSTQGVNFTKTYGEQQLEIVENLKNKTLVVTTILVGHHRPSEGALSFPNLYSNIGWTHSLTNSSCPSSSAHPSLQSAPYCMRKDSPEKLSGNDQFEGYAIDLIHEISRLLGFNYTIRLAPDGRYGSYNKETGYVDICPQ